MEELGDRPSLESLRRAADGTSRAAVAEHYGFSSWSALMAEAGRRLVATEDLHQWFGAQLNNEVWRAIDAAAVSPGSDSDDKDELVYAAFASAHHWRQIGTRANQARAEHLISRVATIVGLPDLALRHATRCLELVEAHAGEMEDWDLGFALEALARAQMACGRVDEAHETLQRARAATAAIVDSGDREIVEGELAREPWFGMT
ncbi:MAG: hypothetical protein HKN07_12305 [Acidimicrobiia bacterium]|nr:hypothetical protein [Acidimicrobiia bacterium]